MANTKKKKINVAESVDSMSMVGMATSLKEEEVNETPAQKGKKERYKPVKKTFLLRYSPELEEQILKIAQQLSDNEGACISINQVIVRAIKDYIKKYGD